MISNLANAIISNKNSNNTETNSKDEKDISKNIKDKEELHDHSKKIEESSNKDVGSFGFDSSVTNFDEKKFDYIEDVEKHKFFKKK